MSSQQLENLKKKIGVCPQLEQNGRLLHMNNPLGSWNEWTVLSYNLNVLGDLMRENTHLRKELEDSVDKYVMHLEMYGKPWRHEPHHLPSYHYSDPLCPPNMGVMMMSQRLEFLEKRFDKLEEFIKEKLGA